MSRLTRARTALAAALAVASVAAACSVSTNDEPVAVQGPFDRIVQATTTTATTTPNPGGSKTVRVYYVSSGEGTTELSSVERPVAADAGVATVLDILFSGPPAEPRLRTDVPDSAVLLDATVLPDAARVIVNTQGLFGQTGVQNPFLRNALGQIVCTATELPSIESVVFQNEGRSVSASVENSGTVDRPVDCRDYDELS